MLFRNPLRRSRLRWLGLGWIIAGLNLLLGGGYALAGDRIILAKGAFAVFAHVPGGLHTHGVIMFGLGLLLAGSLVRSVDAIVPWRVLRPTLIACWAYYAWTVVLFALAPLVSGGTFSYTAVVTWAALSCLPMLLSFAPPPAVSKHRETEFVRTALNTGIGQAQAAALAEAWFRDGPGA